MPLGGMGCRTALAVRVFDFGPAAGRWQGREAAGGQSVGRVARRQ
jgi:hypothetical protein